MLEYISNSLVLFSCHVLGEKSYNFSLTNWPQSNLVLDSQHLESQ